MFARLGRKADSVLRRGTYAVHEAAHATVVHARRMVGAVAGAATRVKRETRDLVWDYQDVAADLRRPVSAEDRPEKVEDPSADGRPNLRVVGRDD
jgi:hypothetical protein